MGKGKGPEDRVDVLRKLAKAQLKLRAAEDQLAEVRVEGEQAIQQVRLEAEKQVAKSRRKVARRIEKIAQLEELLREIDGMPSAEEITPEETVVVLSRASDGGVSDTGE